MKLINNLEFNHVNTIHGTQTNNICNMPVTYTMTCTLDTRKTDDSTMWVAMCTYYVCRYLHNYVKNASHPHINCLFLLFWNLVPDQSWTDVVQYLYQFQRGIRAIQGDGNCLFRALSTILCNNEDNHQHVRRLLVAFCRENKHHFQQFCHPVPIEQHINGMEKDRVWGTDLEIHAAASLWQLKVYVCVPDPTCSSYSWIRFNPISNVITPTQCQEILCPPGVFHLELFYARRCHYDVTVGSHGYVPDYPPPLPEIEDIFIETVL